MQIRRPAGIAHDCFLKPVKTPGRDVCRTGSNNEGQKHYIQSSKYCSIAVLTPKHWCRLCSFTVNCFFVCVLFSHKQPLWEMSPSVNLCDPQIDVPMTCRSATQQPCNNCGILKWFLQSGHVGVGHKTTQCVRESCWLCSNDLYPGI